MSGGRVAIVTGEGGGIGGATARLLVAVPPFLTEAELPIDGGMTTR